MIVNSGQRSVGATSFIWNPTGAVPGQLVYFGSLLVYFGSPVVYTL